jgi:hypothetical protein
LRGRSLDSDESDCFFWACFGWPFDLPRRLNADCAGSPSVDEEEDDDDDSLSVDSDGR